MSKIAVLLLSYGTPNNMDQLWEYYKHIRGGNEPSKEFYEELLNRYQLIGGISPLAEITENQRDFLEKSLNQHSNDSYEVFTGFRHIEPFIEDTVNKILSLGYKEIHGLVLAPHNSKFISQYHLRVENVLSGYKSVSYKKHVHIWRQPNFQLYWANMINEAINKDRHQKFIFTAHSLPIKMSNTINVNEDYETEFITSIKKISIKVQDDFDYSYAWQSAGNTKQKWIGPSVESEAIKYCKEKYDELIFIPIGFVSDNLEILYDNDIVCRDIVEEFGVNYRRLKMPNDNIVFINSLVDEICYK